MASRLNPYLNFQGNTRQAMEFYQSVLGGELSVHTFGDSGITEGVDPEHVMHATLETPEGFTIMAADLPPGMPFEAGGPISVSVSGEDAETLQSYWDGLSAQATVIMPFEPQVWGDVFGMCLDQFGIKWMVDIVQNAPTGD